MTKKVFISYSHKDEEHRQDFEEHLVMLRRRGIISVWHDRKITVGEDWKNSIDENLENADIVIFLVSSSFLASDYCYDIEVARAIKKKDEGSCEIISIIVRPCDWSDCEFSRFQAVPKDAKPITKWDDKDTAWLDAINGIKRHITVFSPPKTTLLTQKKTTSPTPSPQILNWADDTEIILTHRKINKIKLLDIYITPDRLCCTNGKGLRVSVKCRDDDLYPSEISHHELANLQCSFEISGLTDALDRQRDVLAWCSGRKTRPNHDV